MPILDPELVQLDNSTSKTNIDNCLMLSKSSQRESYESLCAVPTPTGTRTHNPVPNATFINMVANHIRNKGWNITSSTYASSFDQGNSHFVFEVQRNIGPGISMQIAGHGSHIKMRSRILYMQTRTHACTNMDVPCEVPLQRKHTTNIMNELPELVVKALTKLDQAYYQHKDRLSLYKQEEISTSEVNDLVIQSLRDKTIPATYIPTIIDNWHEPRYEDFEARNLYTLYNCYTESFKKSPADTPARTQKLTNTLDALVPLADISEY